MRTFAFALSALLSFGGFLPVARADASHPILTIAEGEGRPLSPDVFGQFLERPSWDGEFGPEGVCDERGQLPPTVERLLAGMHAPVVRFPFGTDGDYTDWTDLADLPGRDGRPKTRGSRGGLVTNRFGYPEFFALARRMGWRVVLVANLRDGLHRKKPLAEAASHAGEQLRYALTLAPRESIAAFQIGNEGWFFWPPKPEERKALGLADDAACAAWLRECLVAYADAVRAVAPGIRLICDAPLAPDTGSPARASVSVWRAAIDHDKIRSRYAMVASHAYGPLGMTMPRTVDGPVQADRLSEDQIWYGLVATPGRMDADGRAIADAPTYEANRALGFQTAVTEWNWNGWDFTKQFPQASFGDGLPAALGVAGFLHGMMRHPDVVLATQSMLLGTTWSITAVRVDANGRAGYLPQGEVTRLYAEFHGDRFVESRLEGVGQFEHPVQTTYLWPAQQRIAELDVVVTADAEAWYVHAINRHRASATTLRVRLPRPADGRRAVLHQLTGSPRLSTRDVGAMQRTHREILVKEDVASVVLPAASVTVAVIPRDKILP